MSLTLAALTVLANQCAPAVAPETLLSVVQVESRFDPLTIGVNGPSPKALHPTSAEDAVRAATRLIATGASVDLGLAQINSKNLSWLGLSVADAFDPCRNLAAAAKVLVANYASSARGAPSEQAALKVALSLYNTGDQARGFRNGYVGKVETAAQHVVPALQVSEAADSPLPSTGAQALAAVMLTRGEPEPPTWDVFANPGSRDALVFGAPAQTGSTRRAASKPPGEHHVR